MRETDLVLGPCIYFKRLLDCGVHGHGNHFCQRRVSVVDPWMSSSARRLAYDVEVAVAHERIVR